MRRVIDAQFLKPSVGLHLYTFSAYVVLRLKPTVLTVLTSEEDKFLSILGINLWFIDRQQTLWAKQPRN